MEISPTADYLKTNRFRDTTSLNLSLTPQQEKGLEACLRGPQGSYNPLFNNCGAPIQNCLKNLGIDTDVNFVFPKLIRQKYMDIGIVNRATDVPATTNGKGRNAPWTKKW
jgi:hypothetical protein